MLTPEDFEQIRAVIREATATLATREDIALLATREQLATLATREDIALLATREQLAKLATREDIAPLATREQLEQTETRLLTEFHKWASPIEMRVRSHAAALRAMDAELEAQGDRIKKLEDAS